MPDDRRWVSVGEALLSALDHGVEPDEWDQAINRGVIRSAVLDGHRMLSRDDVEAWARSHGWARHPS